MRWLRDTNRKMREVPRREVFRDPNCKMQEAPGRGSGGVGDSSEVAAGHPSIRLLEMPSLTQWRWGHQCPAAVSAFAWWPPMRCSRVQNREFRAIFENRASRVVGSCSDKTWSQAYGSGYGIRSIQVVGSKGSKV